MPDLSDMVSLTARHQKALIEFLEVDLELGFTFLQTAGIQASTDPDHRNNALDKAKTALDAIRGFQDRVEDPDRRRRIQSRADELEATLLEFKRSPPGGAV